MSFYLIVRGPLGSGKTTVSRALVERLHAAYLSVDQILDEYDLERWEGDFISESSFLAANDVAVHEAEPYLRRGTPVVIDGNFYWRSVVDDLVRRLAFAHLVVTLKVPVDVCVARDAGRAHPLGAVDTRMVFEKSRSFDYGASIDASGSVEETVSRVLDALRNERRVGV